MDATDLYLVRHGQTEWNRLGRYCGRSESPLTDTGRREAEAVAAWIRHLRIDAVYASPLGRARDTAEAIARALERPVRVRRSLVERHYGEWEGLTTTEICAGWPELHARFKEDPWSVTPPGGEECPRVLDRFRRAVLALARVHRGGAVVLVGHATATRLLLASAVGVPLRDYYRSIPLANSAVSLLRARGRALEVVWANRTSHLGAC